MIPIYLRLRNFLSHVDSEIQFDELDLVTLIVGTRRGNQKSSNGAGKCLCGDTLVTTCSGQEIPIKEIVEQQLSVRVLSINDKGCIESAPVIGWYKKGSKDIYQLTTAGGRKIKATDNHPFLLFEGSRSLKELSIGDRIAVPRRLPIEGESIISEDETKLLAYLLAEGGYKTFTNTDQALVEECNICLNGLEAELVLYGEENRASYNIRNTRDARGKHKTKYREWARSMGLQGVTALTKIIPSAVMSSNDLQVALFLGRYLSCDGTICCVADKWEFGYSSSSLCLIRQLQSLLLRFEILADISVRPSRYGDKELGYDTYYLYASGTEDLRRFLEYIGPFVLGEKQQKVQEAIKSVVMRKANTNKDVLPLSARDRIHQSIGKVWPQLRKQGIVGPYYGSNCYSRTKVQHMAEIVRDKFLYDVSHNDIFWDRVVSIEYVGQEEVYDIEVDSDSHYFVADNIFVHNSALFDAITWALYEKSRASGSSSTGIDSIVRGGADKAEVEFHFRLGEDLYRVVRARDQKKRKSDVIFQVRNGKKWQSVGADGKKGTTKKIVNTIGLEYDVFVNSILLEQHEASAFASMTSGERKDVVTKILQLGYYDDYGAQAKKRLEKLNEQSVKFDLFIRENIEVENIQATTKKELANIRDQIKAHQKRAKALKTILEELRTRQAKENKKILAIQDLLEQRDKIKTRIQQSTAGLKEVATRIKKYEAELITLKDSILEKREKILDIKKKRGDPGLIKRDFKTWTARVEELTEKKTAVTIKVETHSSQLAVLEEELGRVENMDEGNCPTCYQNITASSKEEAVKVFTQKIEDHRKQLDKYRQLHKKVVAALEEAEGALEKVQKEKDGYNRLQEEGRSLMSSLDSTQRSLVTVTEAYTDAKNYKKEYSDNLTAAQDELSSCLDKMDDLGDVDEEGYRELNREVATKNTDLESVEATISQLQQKVGGLQERIETQQAIIDKIKEITKTRANLDRERRVEKELINAFGKTGIQALILENSAIEIEKIANKLLSKLTDSSVNIQIQTQKPNQDGTFREVFDILITDEYHSSPFAMYSGGEKFRIAFVIRMALSILLARRAGVKVSAIFYDEAFQDLDEDGIDRMMEVFRLLSQEFRHQLVITHTSQLKDYFDDVITVKKTSEGSFVLKN